MVGETELVVNHEVHIGYSTRSSGAYSFAQAAAAQAQPAPAAAAEAESTDKIAKWGPNNDFPTIIEKEIKKNPDLGGALDWKARALYAGGLTYKIMKADEQGNAMYIDAVIPEIETFIKGNIQYNTHAPYHFYKFFNVFPGLSLSLDRKLITKITAKKPKDSRYGIQNPQTKLIDTLYLNARWAEGADVSDKDTVPIPVIDPTVYTAELLKLRTDALEYIYPISHPSEETYYALANWDSIRQSKWLELANSIPVFKLALMKNQISVKYHIQMPDYWMEWKYPGFKGLQDLKKKELTQAEIKKFDDFLVGVENAGKSITSLFKTDTNTLKAYPGWSITPIEDKLQQGAYLEDSVEATIKIYSALGVDPALAGIIPGGKGGANRSGSDKREALNIYLSLCQMHEDLILLPYFFASEYNGWNAKYGYIVWSYIKPYMQTQNQVTPSQRQTTPNDESADK